VLRCPSEVSFGRHWIARPNHRAISSPLRNYLWCQSSGRQISDQHRYYKPELAFAELGGLVAGGVIFQIVTDGRWPMRYSERKTMTAYIPTLFRGLISGRVSFGGLKYPVILGMQLKILYLTQTHVFWNMFVTSARFSFKNRWKLLEAGVYIVYQTV